MALRLKAHTAEAAMLFLEKRRRKNQFNHLNMDIFNITDIKQKTGKMLGRGTVIPTSQGEKINKL